MLSLKYLTIAMTKFHNEFIGHLKAKKKGVAEYFKILKYYGIVGDLIYAIKDVRFKFRDKLKGKEKKSFIYNKNNKINICNVDCDLNAKLKQLKDLSKENVNIFKKQSAIIVISNFLPRHDRSSSDYRLYNIINILLKNRCRITYIYSDKTDSDERYKRLFKGSISFKYIPLKNKDYLNAISTYSPDYIWITSLWRIDYVKFIAKYLPLLNEKTPYVKIIVDTMDFHFKEFNRRYEYTRNQDDKNLANEFLINETILYQEADVVIVVSEEEKTDIQEKISRRINIKVIPNIHAVSTYSPPFNKRRNICFVGNFGTHHNVDAVRYFLKDIFFIVLKKHPQVEFHIIGYGSENYRKEFSSQNVKVLGGFNNIEEVLKHYKLFVCPMTYGAGMKGKISGAASVGLPIVTTSIGAEGFPVVDGEQFYIADLAVEFGEKCNRCLSDPIVWNNFSVKSRTMIAENFGPNVIAEKLRNILYD